MAGILSQQQKANTATLHGIQDEDLMMELTKNLGIFPRLSPVVIKSLYASELWSVWSFEYPDGKISIYAIKSEELDMKPVISSF